MKVLFRISGFCILFFALIFFSLTLVALNDHLTTFCTCVIIISGILMLISMALTFMFMLLLNAEKQEQSWRDLDKRIEEHKRSLKDKYKPIY